MSAGRYNGWANYETWCVHLWLTTEWDLYHEAVEVARRSPEPDTALDAWVRNCWPHCGSVEPNHLHGMFSDLIGTSLERVDWSGVAGAILEDAA